MTPVTKDDEPPAKKQRLATKLVGIQWMI